MEQLQKAILLAAGEHFGQTDKAGFPLFAHPFRVMLSLHYENHPEDILVAAMLHDTVEDTNMTLDHIEQQFGAKVRYLVDALTRREDEEETYFNYIRRIKTYGPNAITLKLADIADNTDPRRPRIEHLANRYSKARAILLGEDE